MIIVINYICAIELQLARPCKEGDRCTWQVWLLFKSDVVKDALRYMLESKKNLRLAAAIHIYKTGEVSLGKAAEMAGVGIVEFKETLASHGHVRVLKVGRRKDIERADKLLKELASGCT